MGLGIGLGVGWCGCGGASGVGCNEGTVAGGLGITDDTIASLYNTSEVAHDLRCIIIGGPGLVQQTNTAKNDKTKNTINRNT